MTALIDTACADCQKAIRVDSCTEGPDREGETGFRSETGTDLCWSCGCDRAEREVEARSAG